MVVSTLAASLAATRLPAVRRARLARPLMGERTWVLSRFNCAVSTAACAACTSACADSSAARRCSQASVETACCSTSTLARCASLLLRPASLRAGQLRLGPGQFRAVASGIDHEEHIALLDLVSFAIGDPLDVARHPWAQLDALDGFDASVVFVPLRDGLDLDLRDADLRRRWMASGASSGVLFTTCERHRAEGDQYPKQAHAARVGAGSRHLNRFRGQVVKRMKRARSRCTLSPDAAFLAAQDHERQMRQRSNPVGCRLVSSQNARANRPRRHYKASKLEVKRYRRLIRAVADWSAASHFGRLLSRRLREK